MSEFSETEVRIEYAHSKLKNFQNSFEWVSADMYCYWD